MDATTGSSSSTSRPTITSRTGDSVPVSVDRPPSIPLRSLSFDCIIYPLSRSRHEKIRSIQPQRRGGRRRRFTTSSTTTTITRHPFASCRPVTTFTIVTLLYIVSISRSWIGTYHIEDTSKNDPPIVTTTTTRIHKNNHNNERIQGLLEIIESAATVDDRTDHQQRQQQLLTPWPSYLSLHRLDNLHHRDDTDDNNNTAIPQSCIVTAYFQVKSKYNHSKYEEWMQRMLSMSDCMVIFCEEEMVPHMLQFRRQTSNSGPTAVIAVNLQNLPIAKYYYYHHPNHHHKNNSMIVNATAFWQHQLNIDPEKKRHKSYELFWIWLSKSWFVTTAAVLQRHLFPQIQIQQYHRIEFWMWADIGSFRNSKYAGKQLIRFPHKVLQPTDTSTVLWMAHHTPNPPNSSDPFWNAKLTEKQYFYHSGSHAAAATVAAWTQFHRRFVTTLDAYAQRNLFVGEDQCVLQTTCLFYPDSCAYVPFNQVPDNHYFGLRYVLHYGPPPSSIQMNNARLQPFQLWRPPLRPK